MQIQNKWIQRYKTLVHSLSMFVVSESNPLTTKLLWLRVEIHKILHASECIDAQRKITRHNKLHFSQEFTHYHTKFKIYPVKNKTVAFL